MDFVQLIGQVGFPIAVAAYLLMKLEGKLSAAEAAARELSARLDSHTARCEKCQKWRETRTAGDPTRKKQPEL